jgi:tetratricopeptide (TPR) repeat protein
VINRDETDSIVANNDDLKKQNHRNLRGLVQSMQASFEKLNLLVVICDNPQYRTTLIQSYETELREKGVQCRQAKVDRRFPSLKQCLLDLQAEEKWTQPCVVTVLGADELLAVRLAGEKSGREKLLFSLQWTRESLRDFELPVVLWVTSQIAKQVAESAPDFWSWRGGVFEFVQPMTWAVPEAIDRPPMETFPIYQPEELADPADLEQEIKQLLEIEPTSPLLSSLYQSLGVVYFNRLEQGISINRLAEQTAGVVALQSAIDRRKELDNPLVLGTSLSYLAGLYKSMGQYDQALPLYKEALGISKVELGDRHPFTATSMHNLAGLYSLIEQHDQALPLLKSALEITQSELGDRHPSTAMSLNNLAALYKLMGQYDQALPLLESALEIYKSELGNQHPDTATSMHNLATLYQSMEQYDRALPLYEDALEICKTVLGDRHPDTALRLNNLAHLYSSKGQYDRALPLYESALEIRKSALGDRHPSIASSLNNLAGLYKLMEKDNEAEALYKDSISICENLGTDYPISFTVLQNLVGLYVSNNEYYKAEALLTRWLEICYRKLPIEHVRTQEIKQNLVRLKKSNLYNPKSTLPKPPNPKAFGAKPKKGKK